MAGRAIDQHVCRVALFIAWLMVLTPVYSASALQLTFNPDSDVTVDDISAVINFTTDEPATARVRYGLEGRITESAESKPAKTGHSVLIRGIASSTRFQYYIEASNASATVRSPLDGGDFHYFTTEAPRDRSPPNAVRGLAAPTITRDSISLVWESSPADTDIDGYYVFRNGTLVGDLVREKSFTDSGLYYETEYEYKVGAVDLAGNRGVNTSVKATTRAESYTAIAISSFTAEATGTSVYATWTTNMEGHTRLKYSQNPLLLDQKKEDPEMVMQHNMTLPDMPANSNITVMAESCTAEGACANSTPVTVHTTQKIELALSVDGMDCDPGTITYANTNRLTVKGTASPGADLEVYVNGKKERFKRITSTGDFNFAGMDLDANRAQNDIRVFASDHSSPDKECLDTVMLDYMAPEVHFNNQTANLTFATQSSVQLGGNLTDEHKVTLYISVQGVDDTVAPPAPQNISDKAVAANSVTIRWDSLPGEVTDAYKLFIYRSDVPGGPIAFTEPSVTEYVDSNVSTATTYTYQVSVIDRAGNEGARSSPFSVTTLPNGTVAAPISHIVPPSPGLLLTKDYSPNNQSVQFTETVTNLFDGKNIITLKFVDEAGNMAEEKLEVTYEKEPPRIITPTAAEIQSQYSPTYMSELVIRGQVNKPVGEVWVWVNPRTASFTISADGSMTMASFEAAYPEEPVTKVELQENGTFEADVALATSIGAAISGTFTGSVDSGTVSGTGTTSASGVSTAGTGGAGGQNTIVMVAFDQYGRPSQPVQGTVLYTPCGENYYWTVKLNEGGNVLNTRELLEGLAAYGFGYELEWIGGGDATKAKAQNVVVRKATVGAKEREKYDFDWLSAEPRVLTQRGNATKGFIMINFAPQNPPGETYLEREQNLSGHRRGECWPLAGCIHLLLEMEITSDSAPLTGMYNASAGNPMPVGMQAIQPQKQCIDIKIMLDERIDFASSDFVKGLLEASLVAINATINFIEMIEKPIKYATQITLGICLLTYISKFIVDAMKSYYCKWNSALKELSKGGIRGIAGSAAEIAQGKIEKVAGMHNEIEGDGACNVEFPPNVDDTKEANEACKQCADWIGKAQWVTDKWHLFCDRVMCPSVPSLQHYINTHYTAGRRSLWRPGGDSAAAQATGTCTPFSDSAAVDNRKITSPCSCGTGTCQASAGEAARVCRGNACVDVTQTCRPYSASSTAVLAAADLDSNGLCRCGDLVCIAGQTCDMTAGRCAGHTATAAPAEAAAPMPAGAHPCDDNRVGWSCQDKSDACPTGTAAVCATTQGCVQNQCRADAAKVLCCPNPSPATPITGGPTPPGTSPPLIIQDINAESLSLPTPSGSAPQVPLITGFTAGGTSAGSASSPAPAAASSADGSRAGAPRNPVYNDIAEKYTVQNTWKRTDLKNAKSDCEFAEMGRGPISEMFKFYDENKETDLGRICEAGHIPQAACCPFEYMQEWGWGMFWSNEVKMSYCLAEPGAEECGMGETIQRGVTGICQPSGNAPRAVPVILDRLKWRSDYPSSSLNMVNDNVVYLVDIDESGSARSVRRGYFSKSEVAEVTGVVEASGRVEISTGSYFVPENEFDSEDMSTWFPERDNADLSRDSDAFQEGLTAFKTNLRQSIERGEIQPRSTGFVINDAAYEEWYRQIYGLLGDPGRQYLAQPAGSFIQSILTLCLSGILSWIVQFKHMLQLLQQCFQTILVTGDGSSGQCQALISQYICDLIKEAISCLVNRLGGGASARTGMGGISGIFASISDASRGITAEAQSRYGDRNLFGTTFAAENVLHDACIFMFTGEWPTDWMQVFETAAYLPINSTVFVFPVTRRWQAYDPATGYSRYVYRVAYSFFAGANVHYDVKLHCSGPNEMCTTIDGGTEPCDCSHDDTGLARYITQGRQVDMPILRHQSGNCPESGDMTQGQFCSDEILFVGEGFQPLRYDKVVIDYRPTQQMGVGSAGGMSATGGFGGTIASPQAVTGRGEGTIREIGGPPPGLCRFDIGQLAFRCGIEIPPLGYARFISEPLLVKEANQPYTIGDNLIVRAQIQQELPADASSCSGDCQFTKYFVIKEILNQQNARIYPRSNKEVVGERLNENRVYDFTIFDERQFPQHVRENGEAFRIKEEHFSMRSSGTERITAKQPFTGRWTSGFVRTPIIGEGVEPPYAINFSYHGGAFYFTVLNTEVNLATGGTRTAFTPAGAEQRCEVQPAVIDLNSGTNPELVCGGMRFSLNLMSIANTVRRVSAGTAGSAPSSTAMPEGSLVIHWEQQTGGSTTATCTDAEQTWKMTLEIRGADSVGGGGYQMGTGPISDYETNVEQKKTVEFKVVCRGGQTGPAAGSLSDLARMSAVVRAENTAANKTFGLWVDDATPLGPTEEIRVGDFVWVEPGPPPVRQSGFRVNIDSTAQFAILNMDVGRMDLIPGDDLNIYKAGQLLMRCGEAPCIESTGDSNNRVIRIRLSAGDPIFEFTGFRAAAGIEGLPAGGVVLSRTNPAYPSATEPSIMLREPIPSDVRVTLSSFRQNDDGFSIMCNTTPATMIDPVTVGFDFDRIGYSAAGTVSVEGMTPCSGTAGGAAVPAGGGSHDCFDSAGVGRVCYCGPGTGEGALLCAPNQVCHECVSGESGCHSNNFKCVSAGDAGGAAVTDIHSESSSLPVPSAPAQGAPLITGFATGEQPGAPPSHAGTNTLSGNSVSGGSGPAYGFFSGGDTVWVDQSGATLSGNVVVRITWASSAASLVGHFAALRNGYSCGTDTTQAAAEAKFTGCTAGPSASTSGGGAASSSGSGGGSPGASVAGSIPAGSQDCYVVEGNLVFVKSRGATGRTIRVTGLVAKAATAIAKLSDAVGRTVVLTSPRPEQYGVRASGLSGEGQVMMRDIRMGSDSISMNVTVTQEGGAELSIELLPMRLKAEAGTMVEAAGAGALMDCSAGPTTPPGCVVARQTDRIVFRLDRLASPLALRISGLGSTTNECADKLAGESCSKGTCWEPNIPGMSKECYSQCRQQYVNEHRDAIISNPSSLPGEGSFCIPSNGACNVPKTPGLCADSTRMCCSDGSGGPPVYHGSAPAAPAAAAAPLASGTCEYRDFFDPDAVLIGTCRYNCPLGGIVPYDQKIRDCESDGYCCSAPSTCTGTIRGGTSVISGVCVDECPSYFMELEESDTSTFCRLFEGAKCCGATIAAGCPMAPMGPFQVCPPGCDTQCGFQCQGDLKELVLIDGKMTCVYYCQFNAQAAQSNLPCLCGSTKITTAGDWCCQGLTSGASNYRMSAGDAGHIRNNLGTSTTPCGTCVYAASHACSHSAVNPDEDKCGCYFAMAGNIFEEELLCRSNPCGFRECLQSHTFTCPASSPSCTQGDFRYCVNKA
ncbi:fibronectin type III domain-containing protein [Candidatus Woesearchaeota archaeon]|nr:fibronectin type III domain-containing protein [Candidatus Woesearchaeota archaeon]